MRIAILFKNVNLFNISHIEILTSSQQRTRKAIV